MCGLVQVVPMPSDKTISALYHEDLDHFEPYIAQLAVHRKYFRNKVKEIISNAAVARPISRAARSSLREAPSAGISKLFGLPASARPRLLDIGCAMGVLLDEAKKAGYSVRGVDISEDAVAYCRKHGFQVSRQWPKETFDVITAFEIIEHERNPLGMMGRVHALLKNGGITVLTTPNHSSTWRKLMGKWWVGYRHPEHVTFWNTGSLTYLLQEAGFKKIHIRHDTPRPFPLSFLFTRGADYFPWAGPLLRPVGKALDTFHIQNPVNPWDDLIVYATK